MEVSPVVATTPQASQRSFSLASPPSPFKDVLVTIGKKSGSFFLTCFRDFCRFSYTSLKSWLQADYRKPEYVLQLLEDNPTKLIHDLLDLLAKNPKKAERILGNLIKHAKQHPEKYFYLTVDGILMDVLLPAAIRKEKKRFIELDFLTKEEREKAEERYIKAADLIQYLIDYSLDHFVFSSPNREEYFDGIRKVRTLGEVLQQLHKTGDLKLLKSIDIFSRWVQFLDAIVCDNLLHATIINTGQKMVEAISGLKQTLEKMKRVLANPIQLQQVVANLSIIYDPQIRVKREL